MSDIQFSIGADAADYNRGLQAAVTSGTKFAGDIASKVTDKLFSLRDVSNTLAAALGLNLQTIAEKVARAFTGISKEEETAYQKSAALSDQLTKLVTQNMQARLTEEQKYQLAIQERDRLEQQAADLVVRTGADQQRLMELRIQAEERNAEIIAYRAKQEAEAARESKKAVAERTAAAMEEYKAQLQGMTLTEKVKFLKDDIRAQEAVIVGLRNAGIDATSMENQLKAKQKELIEATSDAEKLRVERTRQINGTAREMLELLDLERRSKLGLLTGVDQERLSQLRLQREQRKLIVDATELEAKLLSGTITPEEKKRLDEITKQKEKLEEQIKLKGDLISGTKVQLEEEKKITAELTRQSNIPPPVRVPQPGGGAPQSNSLADSYGDAVNAASQGWSSSTIDSAGKRNIAGGVLGLQNLSNVSSDVLEQRAQQLERQLQQIERDYMQRGFTRDARRDNYGLVSQIDSIERELEFRRNFSGAFARGGREAALDAYASQGRNVMNFDVAFANMESWSKGQDITNQKLDKTNQNLSFLANQMARLTGSSNPNS